MMRDVRGWIMAPLAGAFLLALGGCGEDQGTKSVGSEEASRAAALDISKDTTTVSGTVTVNGKLLSDGEVTFNPKTSSRTDVEVVKAPIGKDGTYSVKTNVGSNQISVSGPNVPPEVQGAYVLHVFQPGDNRFDVVLPRK